MKTIWTIVLVTFGALLGNVCSGCATTAPAEIANGISQAADTTVVICDTAEQLDTIGVEVPHVEQCDTIVPQLTSDELLAVVAVLNCTARYKHGSDECDKCVFGAGWPVLKERIKQLAEKQ